MSLLSRLLPNFVQRRLLSLVSKLTDFYSQSNNKHGHPVQLSIELQYGVKLDGVRYMLVTPIIDTYVVRSDSAGEPSSDQLREWKSTVAGNWWY